MTTSEVEETSKNEEVKPKPIVTSKAGNIRDKFEKSMTEEKPAKKKRPTKIKYAGVNSAKNKFMEEAERTNAPKEDRGPRQFTPPPNGVSVGVLESQPQPRAPGVASADDYQPDDISALSEYTKKLKAKFKQLESGEQQEDIRHAIKTIEEFEMEAIRAKKSMWKDIESGKLRNDVVERKKIDLTEGATNGGVYENEPEVNPDVVKYSYSKEILATCNAKEKLEMLLNSSALQKVKKITPAEELKLLAELEKNSIYENKPRDRDEGIVAADSQDLDDYKTLKTAKSAREKFLDGSVYNNDIKKTVIEIANDSGGVYENEPMRRTDVIRHDDSPEQDQSQEAKWASEAKRRLLEQQAQNAMQQVKKEEMAEGKFATEARDKFLQKQKELEELEKSKATPKIIDIWSEMPTCSGVYENMPAPRSKDIVVCGQSSDEEEETQDPITAS